MTVFPRNFETQHGIDTAPGFPESTALLDVEDIMSSGVADIVINGSTAPEVISLPTDATPKIFGSFAAAEEAYFSDEPTYYMDGSI